MRRVIADAAIVLVLVCLGTMAFAQGSNGTVGGFVQDPSKALIPGASVTATSVDTGVVTKAVTNESGIYNFPSLEPGVYRLTAELPGFKQYTYNGVQLGAGVSLRFNFTLEIGGVTSAVEVSADAASLIAQSSATIGEVLTATAVRDLPLASNNVLDLMATMAGVRGDDLGEATTFAGISTAYVNTTRDGISINENRYNLGVTSTTLINPDLVGEMRVILAPVDAESGRGNGQVQILTKSGGNQFRGSAVWAVRNSALDANTWTNNRQIVDGVWKPTVPDWTNRHQVTVSYGGPIIRNKTFFFALYDQQIENRRTTQNPTVLTDCARNGIFRYWEGWANGNANSTTTTNGANPTRPSVDFAGNPIRPATFADGSPYTGQLRYFSVFGPVTNTPVRADCSDAIVQGSPWNALRPGMDSTGLAAKIIDVMPHANRFESGDGLNTATHQWLRGRNSSGSLNIASGNDNDANRNQINLKFDQHFSSSHKAAVNFSHDWVHGSYSPSTWPTGYDSETQRKPSVLTINFTSTLSPSLLNEVRVGYRKNWTKVLAPWEVTDEAARKVPESMLLQGGGFPIAAHLANVGAMDVNNFMCFTNCAQQGNTSPLYQYSDTLSWTRSSHSFKFGGEFRIGQSKGAETPSAPIPKATGGAGLNPNTAFQNQTTFPGLVTNNQTTANSLLYFLSGSMTSAQQYYYIQTANHEGKWLDYNSSPDHRKTTWSRQNEFSIFVKDDWKISRSFTANLGLRYDYYGVPWEGNGLTAIPVGGGSALFGVSGRSFAEAWMNPNAGVNMDLVTTLEFVGPKTPNPDKTAYKKDKNNFGPAVGFSWQVPWFGEGKTNVRGGYQITFQGGNRYVNLSNYIFNNQGYVYLATTNGPSGGGYFDTQTLVSGAVPITPDRLPMEPVPVVKRAVNAWAFDNNYVSPYVQNFTLSVTRNVSRNLTFDVRYIGTKGVKLQTDLFDLNLANVFYNPALFDALERTRLGENVELFDQMFLGLNLNPGVAGCDPANPSAACGAVNGTTQRGSEHLRRSTTFRGALADGNFASVADSINIFNGTGGGAAGQVLGASGDRGTVLRRANRGFNVPGGTTIAGGPVVPAGMFPENWIVANPQFDQALLFSNSSSSNYHSLQVQGTLRPTYGMSVQGTYVWSKALSIPTTGTSDASGITRATAAYVNPVERHKDYSLSSQHRTHGVRANGTFELPIGPNKLLLPNSSGVLARVLERWQASFIVNLDSGTFGNVTGATTLYAAGSPDIVGPFNLRKGAVHWGDALASGQLVGGYVPAGSFVKVTDPQCARIAASLQSFCTLDAVADSSTGQIVLQNPLPGERGTLGRRTMELPGRWTFDTAMSKTFQLTESQSLQVRLDAENILNHPEPSSPTLDINGTNPLGYISGKGNQHRQLKAQLRLSF